MGAFEPSYLALHDSGELHERAQRALAPLADRCRVCPRLCKVDRLGDQLGLCRVGRPPVVAFYFAHFGARSFMDDNPSSFIVVMAGGHPRADENRRCSMGRLPNAALFLWCPRARS
jgi:hypothetical protein